VIPKSQTNGEENRKPYTTQTARKRRRRI